MRNILKITSIVSLTLLFNACGGGSNKVEDTKNTIVGTWDYITNNSKCELVYNGYSRLYTIKISDDNMQEIDKYFSNNNCDESGLKNYIINNWDYNIVDRKRDKNGESIILAKILNTGTIIKKGTTNKIRDGEERGLAIKFISNDKIVMEDGPANEINSIDVNKIKFSTNSYFQKR